MRLIYRNYLILLRSNTHYRAELYFTEFRTKIFNYGLQAINKKEMKFQRLDRMRRVTVFTITSFIVAILLSYQAGGSFIGVAEAGNVQQSSGNDCEVIRYKVLRPANASGIFRAEIVVRNMSGSPEPAKVKVTLNGNQTVRFVRGGGYDQSGRDVTLSRSGNIQNNRNMRFVYSSTGAAWPRPSNVSLDGIRCPYRGSGPGPTPSPVGDRPCDIYNGSGLNGCVAAHSTVRALYKDYNGPLYELILDPPQRFDYGSDDNTRRNATVRQIEERSSVDWRENNNYIGTKVEEKRPGMAGEAAAESDPEWFKTRGYKTQIIHPETRGGLADGDAHREFCGRAEEGCFILTIFDQSGNGNHVYRGYGRQSGRNETYGWNDWSEASAAPVRINGKEVYGVYMPIGNGGYANRTQTSNIPTGNQQQGIYAVFDGSLKTQPCCFGYGNAQKSAINEGPGTMEALTFGWSKSTMNTGNNVGWGWGGDTAPNWDVNPKGGNDQPQETAWRAGYDPGPYLQADFEWGTFTGSNPGYNKVPTVNENWAFVFGTLKGRAKRDGEKLGNFAIYGGNTNSTLSFTQYWDGYRPDRIDFYTRRTTRFSYDPLQKPGGIILGTGGDNSRGSAGIFYEGAILNYYPNTYLDRRVHAEVVSTNYTRDPGVNHESKGEPRPNVAKPWSAKAPWSQLDE